MSDSTCSACNTVMQLVPRNPCLSGQSHGLQTATAGATSFPAASDAKAEIPPAAGSKQRTCTKCNSSIEQSSQSPHPVETQQTANVETDVETDSSVMGESPPRRRKSKNIRLHPNGKRRIPLRTVAKTHGHVCEIPFEAYDDAGVDLSHGWTSMVTVGDVEAACAAWNARGILHDTDTQWGLMPVSGNYTNSSYYYGGAEQYEYYWEDGSGPSTCAPI